VLEFITEVHLHQGRSSSTNGIWTAKFIPTEDATLRIEAKDAGDHFRDEGGQREKSLTLVGGKLGAQGDLDADPSTPALATWRETKATDNAFPGPPYPWKGYEAGPDTNHHFTVHTMCGPRTQKKIQAMRWGTWTAKIVTTHSGGSEVGKGWTCP
jgi:hypothetical protein